MEVGDVYRLIEVYRDWCKYYTLRQSQTIGSLTQTAAAVNLEVVNAAGWGGKAGANTRTSLGRGKSVLRLTD